MNNNRQTVKKCSLFSDRGNNLKPFVIEIRRVNHRVISSVETIPVQMKRVTKDLDADKFYTWMLILRSSEASEFLIKMHWCKLDTAGWPLKTYHNISPLTPQCDNLVPNILCQAPVETVFRCELFGLSWLFITSSRYFNCRSFVFHLCVLSFCE